MLRPHTLSRRLCVVEQAASLRGRMGAMSRIEEARKIKPCSRCIGSQPADAGSWHCALYYAGDDDCDGCLKLCLEPEHKRRVFMQVFGRHLGWGLVGPNREMGVACFTTGPGPYQYKKFVALYVEVWPDYKGGAPPDDVRDAAEVLAIERAMADPNPEKVEVDWLNKLIEERDALIAENAALHRRLGEVLDG